jgi:PAS domain S-box-containing protein
VLEAHEPFSDFENCVLKEDGTVIWRSISGKPLFDAAGRFTGYRGIGRDITARREAEELIRESKRMYQRVVEGVRDIIFQTDEEGHFVFLNRAWTESIGFGVEETLGESVLQYVHEEDRAAAARLIAEVAAGAIGYVADMGRLRTRDGAYRWFEARMQRYVEPDGHPVLAGTLRDVTNERAANAERRAAEFALRTMQDRYTRALAGANDGIWEYDLVTGIFFCSERMEDLLRLAPGAGPRSNADFNRIVHADDLPVHMKAAEMMTSIRGTHTWDLRMTCGDGACRWFRVRGIGTFSDHGKAVLASGTLTDINESKVAEEELKRHRDDLAGLVEERTASAEAARREAERAMLAAESANRSKSEFLANMSHELRTPMHAILSFANFGRDKAGQAERDKLLHYFANIQKSGARLLTLLNDLLDLSKLEAGKMEMHLTPLDPAELLREAMGEAEALAKSRGIQIELKVPTETLKAQLDGPRMLQVIANLLSNAIKFSPQGGRIEVSLKAAELRAGRRGEATRPGIEISIRDEGIGIPEGELETVFDKFVQSSKTKTGAGGTGLGLAICREIVLAHHGLIFAANNPKPMHGACFHVAVPARAETLA